MTGKTFFRKVSNDETDIIRILIELLQETGASYCVIGGLGVNAYVEPVISLDLDLIVVSGCIPMVVDAAKTKGMQVKEYEHSINLSMTGSDLRIQIQTDPRYQDFLTGAEKHEILGYEMYVAHLNDIITGKVWAYSDETRRKSKRQKDLSDIIRLIEEYPELKRQLPEEIARQID